MGSPKTVLQVQTYLQYQILTDACQERLVNPTKEQISFEIYTTIMFFLKKLLILFSKDAFNRSKVIVKHL